MANLKKILLILLAVAGLAVLVGVGYFARERYFAEAVSQQATGGKTADETMALLVKALGEKDTKTAQNLFNQGNKDGFANWANILKVNESKNLLEVMSKSIAVAVQYGEATDQLKQFAILNKLKTEGLIFSVTPNSKIGSWQISDLNRAKLLPQK